MSGHDSPNTSRTDWAQLEAMPDEDIDYSEIPPLTEAFFERAVLRSPEAQTGNLVALDPEVLAWFKGQGTEYTILINAVLRHFIEAQQSSSR